MRRGRARAAVALVVLVAGCGGPPALAPARAPAPPPIAAPAADVIVLDRGAAPRRRLRYPRGPMIRAVRFTWRSTAHAVDSHAGHDELREYAERRLTGVFASAGLGGLARLAFTAGTLEPERAVRGTWMPGHLAAELPLSVDVSLDDRAVVIAPIARWREQWQAWLYRRALADALPAALPGEPVGSGARWQLVTADADQGRTVTTWQITELDATRLALVGTTIAGARRDDRSSRWSRAVRVETRVAIDLASFAVAATVERVDATHGWSAAATTNGDRTEWSTLAIGAAPR